MSERRRLKRNFERDKRFDFLRAPGVDPIKLYTGVYLNLDVDKLTEHQKSLVLEYTRIRSSVDNEFYTKIHYITQKIDESMDTNYKSIP